jgi:hypothetical protein
MKLKRTKLTELCKRATPEQWTKFITATRVIKIVQDATPKDLHSRITTTYFKEKRHPHVGLFFDALRIRKGNQAIQNRLLYMRAISYLWNTEET